MAGGAVQPAAATLRPPPLSPANRAHGQRPACKMQRRDVQAAHPDLAQLARDPPLPPSGAVAAE